MTSEEEELVRQWYVYVGTTICTILTRAGDAHGNVHILNVLCKYWMMECMGGMGMPSNNYISLTCYHGEDFGISPDVLVLS